VRLDAYTSKSFGEECDRTLERTGGRFVLLDLGQTTYLSSAGLRVFVALGKKLEKQQGRLLLCRLSPYCSEVLEISGLRNLFTVCDSLEQAQGVMRLPAVTEETCSPTTDTWGDARVSVEVLPGDAGADGAVEILGDVAEVLRADMTEQSIASKTFHETEYSIGCGALGDALEDYFPIMGEMMTIGGTMVWLPTDGHNTPDFLIPKGDSRRVTIRTGFNASIAGGFDELFLVTAREPEGVTVENLYRSVFEWAKAHRPKFRGVVSLAGRVEFAAVYGAGIKRSPIRRFQPANGQTILHPSNLAEWFSGDHEARLKEVTGLMCGIGVDLTADLGAFQPAHVDLAFYRHPDNTAGKPHLLHNHAVFFSALPWNAQPTSLAAEIAAVVEQGDFCDMRHLLDQSRISRALLGVSYTQQIKPVKP
jgi:anti-anti-sigma factor